MSSMSRIRRRVKPTRVTPGLGLPFGHGLTCHTTADELWFARFAQIAGPLDTLPAAATPEFAGSEGWMDAAEMEERARQAEWDAKWEATLAEGDRCDTCGMRLDATDSGTTCSGCRFAIEWEGIA